MEETLTPPRPRRTQLPHLPRYDEKLRQAKNNGLHVRLVLGGECYPYTDDDCAVVGKIEEVDKFTLGIRIFPGQHDQSPAEERFVWFNKAAIVSTEILA